ncbi:NAD(P)-dependent alcohol dehydrogenase [Saliphagus infecundisoli]|uniref:NAD(P)-dependent alcohol dehydrogenase n=1 Tax=Saliphagus infecundisoli TaxID=1849069 RepID=A0ABD5QCJ7_9EURY|nr:NAD(P)-dependent alcohol dehydrogenase [Saliphagus infecundisoli]
MKSFVMKGVGETEITEKESPEIGSMDAILKPTQGLICTSDCHTVHGAIGERENLTLGHEVVGVVDEVGDSVTDFTAGDRVAVGAITPDWSSKNAQNGHPSQSNGALGGWKFANVKDGTFAESVHVNDADGNLAHIPDGVTDHEALYTTDMMTTGFAAAENADIPMGGTVAIFAQGPVGLMATKGASLQGAGEIIAVETVDKRQDLAQEYGADHVIDFQETDPVEEILDRTNGEGVDAAIEALGTDRTLQDCIKAVKPGGTVSNVGYHGDGEFRHIPREEWGVGMAEIDIVTELCPGGRLRIERLLQMLANDRFDPTKMTTHEFEFDEIEEAFRMMDEKEDGIIKPLIHFE